METTVLSLPMLDFIELEAFVELMLLAAYTDGEVTVSERAAFRGQLVKGTHGQLDDALVDTVLAAIEHKMAFGDRQAQLESIRVRLSDRRKRQAALAHAARVVLADGAVGVDALAFLHRAASAFGETKETMERILRELQEGSALTSA